MNETTNIAKFQVNLNGIIRLLSKHLYSSPEIFLRELLQNATDAITARGALEQNYKGKVVVELIERADSIEIAFIDNGVGMTEKDITNFLSTIGASKKRGQENLDFIGQFGIGLLSSFMVSEEITLITQSIDKSHPAIKWNGKSDGTYIIQKLLNKQYNTGTQIYLSLNKKKWGVSFSIDRVKFLLEKFGWLLPYEVYFKTEVDEPILITQSTPFVQNFQSAEERRLALLAFGREKFNQNFLEAIYLETEDKKTKGVAFVLPTSSLTGRTQKHSVYLKNMFLSDQIMDILPNYAFFLKAFIFSENLVPAASRESLQQTEELVTVKKELAKCIRQHLIKMHTSNRNLLNEIIARHKIPMKILALEEEAFFEVIIHYLKFPSTAGFTTLQDLLKQNKVVYYTPSTEEFKKVEAIAKSRGLIIINSEFDFDTALLERFSTVFEAIKVQRITVDFLLDGFIPLTKKELQQVASIQCVAEKLLRPFGVKEVIFRKMEAASTIPIMVYVKGDNEQMKYQLNKGFESGNIWSNMLQKIEQVTNTHIVFCLNFNHKMVRKLEGLSEDLLGIYLPFLYIQGLLLGNYSLSEKEKNLLGQSLSHLIDLNNSTTSHEYRL